MPALVGAFSHVRSFFKHEDLFAFVWHNLHNALVAGQKLPGMFRRVKREDPRRGGEGKPKFGGGRARGRLEDPHGVDADPFELAVHRAGLEEGRASRHPEETGVVVALGGDDGLPGKLDHGRLLHFLAPRLDGLQDIALVHLEEQLVAADLGLAGERLGCGAQLQVPLLQHTQCVRQRLEVFVVDKAVLRVVLLVVGHAVARDKVEADHLLQHRHRVPRDQGLHPHVFPHAAEPVGQEPPPLGAGPLLVGHDKAVFRVPDVADGFAEVEHREPQHGLRPQVDLEVLRVRRTFRVLLDGHAMADGKVLRRNELVRLEPNLVHRAEHAVVPLVFRAHIRAPALERGHVHRPTRTQARLRRRVLVVDPVERLLPLLIVVLGWVFLGGDVQLRRDGPVFGRQGGVRGPLDSHPPAARARRAGHSTSGRPAARGTGRCGSSHGRPRCAVQRRARRLRPLEAVLFRVRCALGEHGRFAGGLWRVDASAQARQDSAFVGLRRSLCPLRGVLGLGKVLEDRHLEQIAPDRRHCCFATAGFVPFRDRNIQIALRHLRRQRPFRRFGLLRLVVMAEASRALGAPQARLIARRRAFAQRRSQNALLLRARPASDKRGGRWVHLVRHSGGAATAAE